MTYPQPLINDSLYVDLELIKMNLTDPVCRHVFSFSDFVFSNHINRLLIVNYKINNTNKLIFLINPRFFLSLNEQEKCFIIHYLCLLFINNFSFNQKEKNIMFINYLCIEYLINHNIKDKYYIDEIRSLWADIINQDTLEHDFQSFGNVKNIHINENQYHLLSLICKQITKNKNIEKIFFYIKTKSLLYTPINPEIIHSLKQDINNYFFNKQNSEYPNKLNNLDDPNRNIENNGDSNKKQNLENNGDSDKKQNLENNGDNDKPKNVEDFQLNTHEENNLSLIFNKNFDEIYQSFQRQYNDLNHTHTIELNPDSNNFVNFTQKITIDNKNLLVKKKTKKAWEKIVLALNPNILSNKKSNYEYTFEQPNFNLQIAMGNKNSFILPERKKFSSKNKYDMYLFLDTSGSCRMFFIELWKIVTEIPNDLFNIHLFIFDETVRRVDWHDNNKQEIYFNVSNNPLNILEEQIQKDLKNKVISQYPDIICVFTDLLVAPINTIPKQFESRWLFFLITNKLSLTTKPLLPNIFTWDMLQNYIKESEKNNSLNLDNIIEQEKLFFIKHYNILLNYNKIPFPFFDKKYNPHHPKINLTSKGCRLLPTYLLYS